MGAVVSRTEGELVRLVIESVDVAPLLEIGGSVAVSGVCLTATEIDGAKFHVDVAPETLRRTTLGERAADGVINLELPLRADAPLGGHFVQGHVDGVGRVGFAGRRDGDYVLRV